MARRLGWDSLSEGQRNRYIARGRKQRGWSERQVQSYYESGKSLADLRGHGSTPEKPIPYGADVPKKYQKYYNYRYNAPIKMLTVDGEKWLVSVSKRNRSWIGSHWIAVHAYVFGDRRARKGEPRRAWWWKGSFDTVLDQFAKLTVHGRLLGENGELGDLEPFKFLIDPQLVEAYLYDEDFSFESLYQNVA